MASGDEAKLDMFDDFGGAVEGEMMLPNQQRNQQQGKPEFNTLDEPIRDTVHGSFVQHSQGPWLLLLLLHLFLLSIKWFWTARKQLGDSTLVIYDTLRDVKAVGIKFFHVLYPKEKKSLLKEWDLWGPLVLCTFMAMVLRGSSDAISNDGGPEVAEVFVIVWIGSMIVTLNSKLLGGKISFFQSVCVLGYCLLPTTIALIICRVILFLDQTTFLFILRFVVTMLGFGWATFASMVFLGDSQPPGRKALAVYPIFLFYFVISWLIISHSTT